MATVRDYDLVLFGASGFTGGLTAEYLAVHAPKTAKWALAGRNQAKLETLRARLAGINPACRELALLPADVSDPDSLRRVARSTRVILTTVGPYILYGEPLVAACAEAGTDYADLTGEPEFVDLMWLRYHEQAQRSGARLVHCCGFDSIPHDLGVYFAVSRLPEKVPLKVEGFVRAGGTFSAGTYHSAINAFARMREAARALKERTARESRTGGRKVRSLAARIHYDRRLGTWAVPMPTIDPQVVKRSARALERYGPEFSYAHYLQVGSLAKVAALLGGVGTLFAAAQFGPAREWLLARKQSGEGPNQAQRDKGWFRVRVIGEGGGRRVVVDVSGGDPGYGETSKMLAESGLCMAFDSLPEGAGQLTPAVAMGDALIARLQKAGIHFEVVEGG